MKEDIAVLKEQVKEIKENHLVHLAQSIDKIQNRLDQGWWFLVTTLVGVVITLGLTLWK